MVHPITIYIIREHNFKEKALIIFIASYSWISRKIFYV